MPLESGAGFAGYAILRLLGAGGMGEVYLAQHPRLPRREALKILNSDISGDDDYRRRFIREADLAAALWHTNIVRINDRGECDGQLWISMDFADGKSAANLLEDRYPVGMPADEVATIVTAIASALDYVHQNGLLHRDIKPANILLTYPEHDDRRILLGDFGIARKIGDISGLTATSMTIGTVPYAAPEQLVDDPIDGRADQYALAATAYHLLTGSPLFPQTNPAVVISRHLTAPPPTLAESRPELSAFDPVLDMALAKDPADRFARCADFARAFTAAVDSGGHATASASTRPAPVASRPPGSTPPQADRPDAGTLRWRKRHRVVLWAAAAVTALTAAGTTGYAIETDHAVPDPGRPSAVLDGTYRLDWDYAKQTANGAPYPQARRTSWWAFRSSCTSRGCVATGTQLDDHDHRTPQTHADSIDHDVKPPNNFQLVDGSWRGSVERRRVQRRLCLGAQGKVVAGQDTEEWTSSWVPQQDGTLRGVLTGTILTNECSLQGSVLEVPVAATRTGEVPPGVAVADPGVAGPRPASTPAPGPWRARFSMAVIGWTTTMRTRPSMVPPPPATPKPRIGGHFGPCARPRDALPPAPGCPTSTTTKRPAPRRSFISSTAIGRTCLVSSRRRRALPAPTERPATPTR